MSRTVCMFIVSMALSPATVALAQEVTITWETCAGTNTIVSSKDACYVLDVKSEKKSFEFKLCAGVNVSGGNILFGGTASSMLCAKVTVEAGEEDEALAAATNALRKELEKEKTRKAAQAKLGSHEIEKIGRFKIKKADKKTAAAFWEEIERLNTDPFP